jgi:hypothetical protein
VGCGPPPASGKGPVPDYSSGRQRFAAFVWSESEAESDSSNRVVKIGPPGQATLF